MGNSHSKVRQYDSIFVKKGIIRKKKRPPCLIMEINLKGCISGWFLVLAIGWVGRGVWAGDQVMGR